ncbi:MAG: large conductance mechanosensitive channel protein MscL [Clostridiales bacterium]|nr:large conductance mechanosensitive channel protein MscL [Clostridiales bacterium]
MKKFFKEFKDFAMKGNVIDLAIAVVIGGAFGKIVTSLVNDVFMPLIGLITGGTNVSGMFAVLGKVPEGTVITSLDQAAELGVATLNYGLFIQAIIDFILVALCLFLVVKAINKSKDLKKKEEEAPAEPTTKVCPFCQSEISIKATKCPHCTSDLKE